MPVFRLKCVLQSANDRGGAAFESTDITAETTEGAITQAKDHLFAASNMALSEAVLTSSEGHVVWTLKAPKKTT